LWRLEGKLRALYVGEWLVGFTHWLTVYRSLLDRTYGQWTDLDTFVMIKVDGDVCDDNDDSKVGCLPVVGFAVNLLKTKHGLLCIRNHSVPRCKHFPRRL